MNILKRKKYFGDILPEDMIYKSSICENKSESDAEELIWEVFTSRPDSEEQCKVSDEYVEYPENDYITDELKELIERLS